MLCGIKSFKFMQYLACILIISVTSYTVKQPTIIKMWISLKNSL